MMDGCRWTARFVFVVTAATLAAFAPSVVQAQTNGGGDILGGNFQNAGVVIDTDGVLRMQRVVNPGSLRAKVAAAMATIDPKLAKPSEQRKISLNRLEKAVATQSAAGQDLTDEMKYLAGLLRVEYVFFYPETGDIVLAGPAEGFAEDLVGRVRGVNSGRPVLLLQDLVTALRAYPPAGDKLNLIGVSIDPTPEGLARLQQAVSSIGQHISPGQERQIAATLRNALGMQNVTFQGISPKTHFAQVLVEADYRMKLIGIGLEQPPAQVKIPCWAMRADPRGGSQQLQRWYFVPDYQCVRVADDGSTMQLEGRGVKLVGASEMVQRDGVRQQGGVESKASKEFCNAFTTQYQKLADIEPVYAQLRNLIDLSVAAAFIQDKDFYQQASWDLGVFADESQFPVETMETPRQVESTLNVIRKGARLTTPIGGGVHVEPLQALSSKNVLTDEDGKVSQAHDKVSLKDLPEGQWWWD